MKIKINELIENASNLTATEFTDLLDSKKIQWMYDDVDNISDYNDGQFNMRTYNPNYQFIFDNGELTFSGEL